MFIDTIKLQDFFNIATQHTYAGAGGLVAPWKLGFTELEYAEGDWYYRDSYTGHVQSWGQETVWYMKEPVWVQNYGGGLEEKAIKDTSLIVEVFSFLKTALGAKEKAFQPRGPRRFHKGSFTYETEFAGALNKFEGVEFIVYKHDVVFSHRYCGGLVLGR